MGIDALPIAATPESILVSPQARSLNGTAVLNTPTRRRDDDGGISVGRGADAARDEDGASSGNAEKTSRRATSSSARAPDGDLDEHERRAPDRGEQEQEATLARIKVG